jgi:hypothetical protein
MRKWYIRPFVYTAMAFLVLYGSHFTADLLIPYETTDEHRALAQQYLAEHSLPTPHEPFHTDGCTLFPDWLPWHDFTAACLQHDIAYWAGGSEALQQQTNEEFRTNLHDSGPYGEFFGTLMYIGVVYIGDNGISRLIDSHWGYGWS